MNAVIITRPPGVTEPSLKMIAKAPLLLPRDPTVAIPCECCKIKQADMKCGRCKSYYYCSKECQATDWKQHKIFCNASAQGAERFIQIGALLDGRMRKSIEASKEPCPICFEVIAAAPILLPCDHAFCKGCMERFHRGATTQNTACPLCRQENDVFSYVLEMGDHFIDRGYKRPAEAKLNGKFARLEIRSYPNEIVWHFGKDMFDTLEADCLCLEGNYQQAIALAEETLKVCTLPATKVNCLNVLIRSHLALKKYHYAHYAVERISLMSQMHGQDPGTLADVGRTRIYLSQCYYGMGLYQQSLAYGKLAAESVRGERGCHKYWALSYYALGMDAEAILVMKRAVRYEDYWLEDNTKENQALLEAITAGTQQRLCDPYQEAYITEDGVEYVIPVFD